MKKLIAEIKSCVVCKEHLPNAPKPVFTIHPKAIILIIGQAPGQKVQDSGIPWDDQSGNELRRWLGVTREEFYDPEIFALMPMGFCYPGKGTSGDLPPRPECAPLWHHLILKQMKSIQLIILIGQYSQKYYLGAGAKLTLTETVKCGTEYLPQYMPLVHPSPRNKIWHKKNPWFEKESVPQLQRIIRKHVI
jgi:uracil-DNA glycosylase